MQSVIDYLHGYDGKQCLSGNMQSVFLTSLFCFVFLSTESIKKIVDKSSIKFVHGIKLDTKSGKTEDRILVSRCSLCLFTEGSAVF